MIKNSINIKIGIGEAADRHSILTIKSIKIVDQKKLSIIIKQCEESANNLHDIMFLIKNEYHDLLNVNSQLWEVEDKLRKLEAEQRFNDEFVQLARDVYHLNDRRHFLKCKIDDIVGYKNKEQKEYVKYEKDSSIG